MEAHVLALRREEIAAVLTDTKRGLARKGGDVTMVAASSWMGEDRVGANLKADGFRVKGSRTTLSGATLESLVQSNGRKSIRPTRWRTPVGVRAQQKSIQMLPHFKVSGSKETVEDGERLDGRVSMRASMQIDFANVSSNVVDISMDRDDCMETASNSSLTGMMIANNSSDHGVCMLCSRVDNEAKRMTKNSGTERPKSAKARRDNKNSLIGGIGGNIRQGGKIILPQFKISEARETRQVCRVLQEDDGWTLRVEQALWALSPKLQTHILARVLKLQTNPCLAWKVFQWAESLPGFEHDSSTFYALIEVLGKAEDLQSIWTLINDMRIAGIRVKPIPFTFLISSYGRAGKIRQAELTFHSMREFNCKPNVYTYNAILYALLKANKTERAIFTYQKMLSYGCQPDDVTLNTLINGLCVNNHTEAAAFYLKDMLNLGLAPDMRTFNIVIGNHLKSGHLQKALNVYESALKTGCTPSTITHSMLLDYLFKMGKYEDALNLFKEMTNSVYGLDTVVFTTVLHGLLKCNKVEMAFAFLKILVKRGCANVATFNVVLDWFCKQKEMDKAMEVVQGMKERGIFPNTLSYNSLIWGSFKDGRAGMGLAFATQMMDEGCKPDLITYSLLIEFFLKQDEIDDALTLLKEMIRDGFQPDTVVFNPILLGLFRAGRTSTALSVAKEMILKGCRFNKMTYHVLNSWLCEQGQSDEALKFMKEMRGLGFDARFLLQIPNSN